MKIRRSVNHYFYYVPLIVGILLLSTLMMLRLAPAQESSPPSQDSSAATPALTSSEAIASPPSPSASSSPVLETPKSPSPASSSGSKLVNLAPPAKRFGDGIIYIGHRYYRDKGGGWGWIKKEGDSWSSAKWVALKEDPIHGILMPSRQLNKRDADHDYEYRMTGYFSEKEAYDPQLDEIDPIFVLESYESLGPAKPLNFRPGASSRYSRSQRGSGLSPRGF